MSGESRGKEGEIAREEAGLLSLGSSSSERERQVSVNMRKERRERESEGKFVLHLNCIP